VRPSRTGPTKTASLNTRCGHAAYRTPPSSPTCSPRRQAGDEGLSGLRPPFRLHALFASCGMTLLPTPLHARRTRDLTIETTLPRPPATAAPRMLAGWLPGGRLRNPALATQDPPHVLLQLLQQHPPGRTAGAPEAAPLTLPTRKDGSRKDLTIDHGGSRATNIPHARPKATRPWLAHATQMRSHDSGQMPLLNRTSGPAQRAAPVAPRTLRLAATLARRTAPSGRPSATLAVENRVPHSRERHNHSP